VVHIVSRPNTGASMFSSSLHKSFLEAALVTFTPLLCSWLRLREAGANYVSVPALPDPSCGVPAASAIKTNSRPGRSGASRTSFTMRSALRSDSTISSRLRKRSVESEVSTAPSVSKTNQAVEKRSKSAANGGGEQHLSVGEVHQEA
jgi:hypothetical protein